MSGRLSWLLSGSIALGLGGAIALTRQPEVVGLLTAAVMGAALVVAVAVKFPSVGLALAIALTANPYFHYLFLFSTEFEGGWIRATTSLALGLILAARVRFGPQPESDREGARVLAKRALFAALPLLMVGATVGVLKENDAREILAECFPFVEFYLFFYVADCVFRMERGAARRSVVALVILASVSTAIELAGYVILGEDFASRWSAFGAEVPRLSDFMPAILLPLSIGLALGQRAPYRRVLWLVPPAIFSIAVVFSFYRTLWISVVVALAYVLVRVVVRGRSMLSTIATVFVLVLIVTVAGETIVAESDLLPDLSVWSVVAERVSIERLLGDEFRSGQGRIDAAKYLVDELLTAPILGKGFGGVFFFPDTRQYLPLSSAPNYYLSLAAQLGLPSASALAVIAGLFLTWSMGRRAEGKGGLWEFRLGLCGSIVSVLVTLSAFPALLHFPIAGYLAMACSALLANDISLLIGRDHPRRIMPRGTSGVGSAMLRVSAGRPVGS